MNLLVCIILKEPYQGCQLFLGSGAIPEYCNDFGVSFNDSEVVNSIESMILEYDKYKLKLRNYPYTATKMTSEY